MITNANYSAEGSAISWKNITNETASGPDVQRQAILDELKQHLASWGVLWGLPGLAQELRIEFSQRLSHALGICDGRNRLLTLSKILLLKQNRHLLLATLCHEAAHFAAWRQHGVFIAPHGTEWRALMRAAGFNPRVARPMEEIFGMEERLIEEQRLYQYHCAVCGITRVRAAKNGRLRCGACVNAGRKGLLTITVMTAPCSKL